MKELSKIISGVLVDSARFDFISEQISEYLKYFKEIGGEYKIIIKWFSDQEIENIRCLDKKKESDGK